MEGKSLDFLFSKNISQSLLKMTAKMKTFPLNDATLAIEFVQTYQVVYAFGRWNSKYWIAS